MQHFRSRWLLVLLAVLGLAVAPAGAFAADKLIFAADGAAIRGYDPVAYFTESKPVKGRPEFQHTWKGATWRFATAANRDAFAATPEKYAPRYGGYCAWAVSRNYTASTDPDAWRVVDGKLYLNYSKNVQENWAKDVPGNVAKGDANWPGLAKKLAE
ncbi:MAG: YHS domain-containing protein [Rhodospirillales bacterium]|nr:YHS domain-containing protein [Rhodospirillales bacterium]